MSSPIYCRLDFYSLSLYDTRMKLHISKAQFDHLPKQQREVAQSYWRLQEDPKEREYHEFWSIGRMIEYLDEYAFLEISGSTTLVARWNNIYGFNLSSTLQEEWCDKLWARCKERFQETIDKDPFTWRE